MNSNDDKLATLVTAYEDLGNQISSCQKQSDLHDMLTIYHEKKSNFLKIIGLKSRSAKHALISISHKDVSEVKRRSAKRFMSIRASHGHQIDTEFERPILQKWHQYEMEIKISELKENWDQEKTQKESSILNLWNKHCIIAESEDMQRYGTLVIKKSILNIFEQKE